MDGSDQTTFLLKQLAAGDKDAEAKLMPLVYAELRRNAAVRMKRERASHTLQPTALVHEVWMKLIGQAKVDWKCRAHFIAIATTLMQQVLTDHGRKRYAVKRGAGRGRVAVDLTLLQAGDRPCTIDMIDLTDALNELETLEPRQARVARMRLLGELSVDEIAAVLSVSDRTVKSDWRFARVWLADRLGEECGPDAA